MAEPPQIFEYKSYASGINAAALPLANIRPDELPLMVNATVRRGFAQTRPPWVWQPLSFPDKESQYLFERGKFQGCDFFLSDRGNAAVFAVEGHVFAMDPMSGLTTRIALSSGKAPFSKESPHVWLKQRSKWMVAQDGVSPPLRSDGVNTEQSLTYQGKPSIPTGTIMAEGWGRLFVVDPSRRRIYASDHEMNPTSTPISFTELTAYYLSSRYFEGPPSLGKIVGAEFTPFQDSSTGIGPLVVFFEKGVKAYNVQVDRTQWVTSDISQTILPRVGASSFFAYADRGSELVFRDQDGHIRTIRNAQQFEAMSGNRSTDFNIWDIIKTEDPSLRAYSHSVTFDKRTFTLTHGERSYLPDGRFSVVHKGMAVMENENLSDKQDVWSFWTGLRICGLTVGPLGSAGGEQAMLAFCRDPDGVNRVYRLATEAGQGFDIVPNAAGKAVPKSVRMTLSTPLHDFGNPSMVKRFVSAGARFSGLRGAFKVCASWQVDNSPPVPWLNHQESFANCVDLSSVKGECVISQFASGVQPRLLFPFVPKGTHEFYSASATLDVSGPATLEEMAIAASIMPPPGTTNVTCTPVAQTPPKVLCEVNPFCYDAFNAPEATNPPVTACPLR